MRPWHYIDFLAAQPYSPSIDDNLINRLTLTYNELKHKNVLCEPQVKFDLLVLLHLMGDLGMPLHTGYEDDLGGNKRMVQFVCHLLCLDTKKVTKKKSRQSRSLRPFCLASTSPGVSLVTNWMFMFF